MRQTCAFIELHQSCQIPAREFPAQPHSSVRTQSNPCLDVHIHLLVQHGQLSTAWWFPSATNVHVQLSASYSRHLPSSSTSHWRRIRTTQMINSTHSSGGISWGPFSIIISGIRWVSIASLLFHILLKQSFEAETRGRKQQITSNIIKYNGFVVSTIISVRRWLK